MTNAVNWFEIPVADLQRAKRFYGTVLQAELREESMGDMTMAILPHAAPGVGGALVVGKDYQPSPQGPVIYLNAGADIDGPLSRIPKAGGKILMGKTFLSKEIGHIALFLDCEGNRMALHSPH